MQTSSRRVGPRCADLKVLIQPYDDHVTWSLVKVTWAGSTSRGERLESGSVPMSGSVKEGLTARSLLALVLDHMRPLAQPPAPPLGDMGEQLTLDLDFSA